MRTYSVGNKPHVKDKNYNNHDTQGEHEQTHIPIEKRYSGEVGVNRKLLIPFFDAWSRYIQT